VLDRHYGFLRLESQPLRGPPERRIRQSEGLCEGSGRPDVRYLDRGPASISEGVLVVGETRGKLRSNRRRCRRIELLEEAVAPVAHLARKPDDVVCFADIQGILLQDTEGKPTFVGLPPVRRRALEFAVQARRGGQRV